MKEAIVAAAVHGSPDLPSTLRPFLRDMSAQHLSGLVRSQDFATSRCQAAWLTSAVKGNWEVPAATGTNSNGHDAHWTAAGRQQRKDREAEWRTDQAEVSDADVQDMAREFLRGGLPESQETT